jgi:hypothetical protein
MTMASGSDIGIDGTIEDRLMLISYLQADGKFKDQSRLYIIRSWYTDGSQKQ